MKPTDRNDEIQGDRSEAGQLYDRLYSIIKILRGPGGCPWDREQTADTLLPNLIEEAYELIEAVHDRDIDNVREELGDLFLLVGMISYMYEQESAFSVRDVLAGICEKLIRRHPHVFTDQTTIDADAAIVQWEQIKLTGEGKPARKSILDGIPRALPPLEKSLKIQKKVARVGFDWKRSEDVLAKIREEADELAAALAGRGDSSRSDVEMELGDLLFSVVNLARFIGIDPSSALHKANAKFDARFRCVENELQRRGFQASAELTDLMEELWQAAKLDR